MRVVKIISWGLFLATVCLHFSDTASKQFNTDKTNWADKRNRSFFPTTAIYKVFNANILCRKIMYFIDLTRFIPLVRILATKLIATVSYKNDTLLSLILLWRDCGLGNSAVLPKFRRYMLLPPSGSKWLKFQNSSMPMGDLARRYKINSDGHFKNVANN
jgi:hypothetical protein